MKTFITTISIAIFLFFSPNSYSQQNSFSNNLFKPTVVKGLKAGVGFSNLISDNDEGIGSKTSYSFGGLLIYNFSPVLAFQSELLYSLKGSEYDSDNGIYLNYLDIPLLFKKYFSNSPTNRFSIFIGLQPSFYLNGDVKIYGTSYSADRVKSIDLAIPLGLDYQFSNNILLDIRYNLGLLNITESGTLKNYSIIASFGYLF